MGLLTPLPQHGQVGGVANSGDRTSFGSRFATDPAFSANLYLAAPVAISVQPSTLVGTKLGPEGTDTASGIEHLGCSVICRTTEVWPLPYGQSVETGVVLGYRLHRHASHTNRYMAGAQ